MTFKMQQVQAFKNNNVTDKDGRVVDFIASKTKPGGNRKSRRSIVRKAKRLMK